MMAVVGVEIKKRNSALGIDENNFIFYFKVSGLNNSFQAEITAYAQAKNH